MKRYSLFDENPIALMHLNVEPAFDRLRSDPRFNALLEQMNIARLAETGVRESP